MTMGAKGRLIAALAALGALVVSGCGEDDFANEPRPAAPVELTARIDERGVAVSPSEVGAGLVTLTISNQSDEPAEVVLEGPTDVGSDKVLPSGVGSAKFALEQGSYTVTAGEDSDLRGDRLRVGPERESSQNELLLP